MAMKVFAAFLCLVGGFHAAKAEDYDAPSCSLSPEDEGALDPGLVEMKFDLGLGDGEETFLAYAQPNVTSFYKDTPPASTKVSPKHTGLAGMFINMSNRRLRLYWESYRGGPSSLIDHQAPFGSGGTASFPGHLFFYTPEEDPSDVLIRFTVGTAPESVHCYDPYYVPGDEKQTKANLARLSQTDYEKYMKMRRTYLFNEEYKKVTGRSYLVNFPRPRPIHHMWRADYFGQEHWVTTRETHFVETPPKSKLGRIVHHGKARKLPDSGPRLLQPYRQNGPLLNMTLKVLSCAPRVFEIKNFLSPVEVDHILNVASGENLARSQTGFDSGESNKDDGGDVRRTRTSYNSWIERERTPVLDAIYRRTADLLRIDEALLRGRDPDEFPEIDKKGTMAESLQLVHYDPGQEYTAHHDFGYSDLDEPVQGQRFSTLLLYLNEGMEGGSTSFPRWVNAETFEELRVIPEAGKAVLFYSQLPDGNMDDLSQHQANKVRVGEKWLANVWIWSPAYAH